MRIRMTDPAPGQKGRAREVSDSYGLRLVSQGRAVALPPLSTGGAAPKTIIPTEKEPEKGEWKPKSHLPAKGTKGTKGGAGDGA